MLFPTTDATAEEGEIVGQNTAVTALETTFGQASLDVYKYSSKSIALPFELLQDSMFDIEAYIQNLLRLRLGRIQDRHHVLGTGTAQPKGVIAASTAGKVGTTGQTTSVIYDDLVDLEHSVDPAYRAAARGAAATPAAGIPCSRRSSRCNTADSVSEADGSSIRAHITSSSSRGAVAPRISLSPAWTVSAKRVSVAGPTR